MYVVFKVGDLLKFWLRFYHQHRGLTVKDLHAVKRYVLTQYFSNDSREKNLANLKKRRFFKTSILFVCRKHSTNEIVELFFLCFFSTHLIFNDILTRRCLYPRFLITSSKQHPRRKYIIIIELKRYSPHHLNAVQLYFPVFKNQLIISTES